MDAGALVPLIIVGTILFARIASYIQEPQPVNEEELMRKAKNSLLKEETCRDGVALHPSPLRVCLRTMLTDQERNKNRETRVSASRENGIIAKRPGVLADFS